MDGSCPIGTCCEVDGGGGAEAAGRSGSDEHAAATMQRTENMNRFMTGISLSPAAYQVERRRRDHLGCEGPTSFDSLTLSLSKGELAQDRHGSAPTTR